MSSTNNWKNPSSAQMQKYDLVPLPNDFEPTDEEKILLDMYETISKHERQAARLKEEAARARLAARDAEFQQKIAPKRKTNRKKAAKKENTAGDDDEEEDEDEQDVDDEQEDEDTIEARRQAKLAALREEVEAAKQAQSNQQETLREELLQTQETEVVEGPLLKRKKVETDAQTSLIANLTAGSTPPHDFSKKYELTAARGKTLFPTSIEEAKWTPPPGVYSPNEGAFEVNLEDFDVTRAQNGQGNNTLAIKFMAPSDSKRFSINIAMQDNDSFNSVLFHFNPRQHERGGQLVVNDKQNGIWGQAIAIPLSQLPLMFGQTSCTLLIQINGDGFDIFIEEKHCARLEHRTELPSGQTNLVLQFPSTDDYGSPENWAVFKVWWGNRPILAKGDLSGIAGVNTYNALHPRKLFISGLAKIFSEPEVDLRRAELERAFRKYGGARGVHVIVPTNSTYAFVECESERQADLALSEMASQYRLNRARRSKHEALQEERAAKEAAAAGVSASKETRDWD